MSKFRIGQWVRTPGNFNIREYRNRWVKVIYVSGIFMELEVSPGKTIDATFDDIGQKRGLSHKERYEILERDDFRCQVCGRTAKESGTTLHIDHKTPWSRGGKTSLGNLQTLCRDCNLGKSDK